MFRWIEDVSVSYPSITLNGFKLKKTYSQSSSALYCLHGMKTGMANVL